VPAVVLYREAVTKGDRWVRCGLGLPIRSFRASWERLQVDIDHGPTFSVKTATRQVVMLPPGRHEIHAQGRGFVAATTSVELAGEQRVIVAITPQYLSQVTRATPLGELSARVVAGPEELHPYRFYKSWPLFISAVGSASVASAAIAALGAALYVLSEHVLVGLLLFGFICAVAPGLVLSGIGGLVTALRFLRLSSDWRAPRKMGTAPVAPATAPPLTPEQATT
jgi:hypothetical protein